MNDSMQMGFSGSIPENYDRYLGPWLFVFSAEDLTQRIANSGVSIERLLEVACGTGISTEILRKGLPAEVEITATDINPAMLDYAKTNRGSMAKVQYELADGTDLPYEDDSFDCLVCQYGIMFFPDLEKGFAEMARVLKPGGFVALNIWDSLEANPGSLIAHKTISRFFDADPPKFLTIPFGSVNPAAALELMASAGFERLELNTVEVIQECPDPTAIARGAVTGNPTIVDINERANASAEAIIEAVAEALRKELGDPLRTPLREFALTGYAG